MSHKRVWSSLLFVLVVASSAAHASDPPTAERIARVENGFVPIPVKGKPELKLTLTNWMKLLNVPGLSIAVFDDFQVKWAKGYGVAENGGSSPVTPETLFQAGSISKPVAATVAMYYVERGKLSLDEDVNSRLVSWKVPENEFTEKEKVTLRRIMSHTAGLTVHGFPGYSTDEPLPRLVQVLNGQEPANTAAIRVDVVPGTITRYSGGTTVMQQLLVDVFKKPFPRLARETVFDRIGMRNSGYEQPLPRAREGRAASGHRSNSETVKGKWHVYPEMAAAGLWTTPTDLARLAIEIAKAWNGKSKLLSEGTARQMLTPVNGDSGLGFFFPEKDNPRAFDHGGVNQGFQARLVAFADTGQGAVLMTNSDNGIQLINIVLANIGREYGWKIAPPKPAIAEVMLALVLLRDAETAIAIYNDLKQNQPEAYNFDEYQLNNVGYALMRRGRLDDALKIFHLNVEVFPEAWNPWDSLGEANMTAGNKELAIKYYEKSLSLNPKNENAVTALATLRSAPAKKE
jgi:CubicO group peptidase (beta-lactamase class C family)